MDGCAVVQFCWQPPVENHQHKRAWASNGAKKQTTLRKIVKAAINEVSGWTKTLSGKRKYASATSTVNLLLPALPNNDR